MVLHDLKEGVGLSGRMIILSLPQNERELEMTPRPRAKMQCRLRS